MAIMSGMYAVYHGQDGIKSIASRVHAMASTLDAVLRRLGYVQQNTHYFDTLFIETGDDTEKIREIAEAEGVNFLYVDDDAIGISLNEATTMDDLNRIIYILAAAKETFRDPEKTLTEETHIPEELARKTLFLTQEVFKKYRSETEMMRYIKKLERRDISLTHSMIPLGSCTMKLNAASEMIPLSHPSWGDVHPFAPEEQTEGYRTLLARLENLLSTITGMSATSLQPLSGASGEYAGLRVIQGYLKDSGQGHRNVCLIPASAHGTNPASAAMAGFEIITIKSCQDGHDRRGRPPGTGRGQPRPSGMRDDYLPVHIRHFRVTRAGNRRYNPRKRRTGVHGRSKHECAGGIDFTRLYRRRRMPPQPAQDIRHASRRRPVQA